MVLTGKWEEASKELQTLCYSPNTATNLSGKEILNLMQKILSLKLYEVHNSGFMSSCVLIISTLLQINLLRKTTSHDNLEVEQHKKRWKIY